MKKKTGIITGIVCALALVGFMVFANPLKVIDPADPRFDPDKFSFSDYHGREELVDAFRKLFPPGTPKEFVDRVLVDAGNAKSGPYQSSPQMWSYHQPQRMFSPMGPMHQFTYDKNQKLLNIRAYAEIVLYPNEKSEPDLNTEGEQP